MCVQARRHVQWESYVGHLLSTKREASSKLATPRTALGSMYSAHLQRREGENIAILMSLRRRCFRYTRTGCWVSESNLKGQVKMNGEGLTGSDKLARGLFLRQRGLD